MLREDYDSIRFGSARFRDEGPPPNYRKQTDKTELKATRHEKTSELQSYIDIYTRAIYTRIDIIK